MYTIFTLRGRAGQQASTIAVLTLGLFALQDGEMGAAKQALGADVAVPVPDANTAASPALLPQVTAVVCVTFVVSLSYLAYILLLCLCA